MAEAQLKYGGNRSREGDGRSLAEIHASALSFAERCRLTRDLAAWIRAAHDNGERLCSLPAIGIVVHGGAEGWTFAASDRLSGANASPLGQRARLDDLARLYADLLPRAGRGESLRFFRAYLPAAEKEERRRAIGAIETRALRLLAARWRREGRQALANAGEFRREQAGAFRIYRRAGAETEAVRAALLPDPDRLLAQGEILFGRGNSCTAARVNLAGRSYILKKYHCRGWLYRLRHFFRRSRALRNWLSSWRFRLRGAPLPAACLCLEERRWGFLGRSYIVTEYFDGMRLSDFYPPANASLRRAVLAQLAVIFGRLHRFGGIHGDTNWDNILLRPQGNAFAVALVDLDGSRILPWPRPKRAARDIWHFVRDLKRRGGDRPGEIEFFIRCWARWAGYRGHYPLG